MSPPITTNQSEERREDGIMVDGSTTTDLASSSPFPQPPPTPPAKDGVTTTTTATASSRLSTLNALENLELGADLLFEQMQQLLGGGGGEPSSLAARRQSANAKTPLLSNTMSAHQDRHAPRSPPMLAANKAFPPSIARTRTPPPPEPPSPTDKLPFHDGLRTTSDTNIIQPPPKLNSGGRKSWRMTTSTPKQEQQLLSKLSESATSYWPAMAGLEITTGTITSTAQSKRRSISLNTGDLGGGSNNASLFQPGSPRLGLSEADLNAIPDVQLPGFTPDAQLPSPLMAAAVTASNSRTMQSPSVLQRVSGRLAGFSSSSAAAMNSPAATGDPESQSPKLTRKRSLVKPERARQRRPYQTEDGLMAMREEDGELTGKSSVPPTPSPDRRGNNDTGNDDGDDDDGDGPKRTPWRIFSWAVTFYACAPCLDSCLKTKNKNVHQAWREKMALVSIIVMLWVVLGFITFGFESLTCGANNLRNKRYPVTQPQDGAVSIRGDLYDISSFSHPGQVDISAVQGKDVSWMFPLTDEFLSNGRSACSNVPGIKSTNIPCTADGADLRGHCHTAAEYRQVVDNLPVLGKVSFTWEDIEGSDRYLAYGGWVLNLQRYFKQGNDFVGGGEEFQQLLVANLGSDASLAFTRTVDLKVRMDCLAERFRVGVVEAHSPECMASQAFMWLSFCVIISVILLRFLLAIYYMLTKAKRFGRDAPVVELDDGDEKQSSPQYAPAVLAARGRQQQLQQNRTSIMLPKKSRFSMQYNMHANNQATAGSVVPWKTPAVGTPRSLTPAGSMAPDQHLLPGILRTIMLVTCYSEDEKGMRITLDSLAETDFPDTHKLLFIIADGLITGSGNAKSTPDTLIDMLELDPQFANPPQPMSYVAIADGSRRHNMAQVYAGRYRCGEHIIPAVLVVKCGTPAEQSDRKPGNRGKRDSQVLMMNFLSKVLFDERMTSLEYDLFTKITAVSSSPDYPVPIDSLTTRVTPDQFELVLMVDADTKVMPESMRAMSYTMASDPKIIGLCGETRIANKSESWVTSIQVFEYYLAHFMTKNFESVFGKCTCLPGCFCMYRIKTPKGHVDEYGNQYYVPILANPDIVEAYSENVVDTLHKKNLLLLGEDRYLTTLMLKTFPKRDLVFVPRAVCKTQVPSEFRVLLSQRRRWINSTVHNLLELVLLPNLCGLFCLSLNFIIFMELVGTAVLPAAISFTIYLIVLSFVAVNPPIIPLILLAVILGLPALLLFFTIRRIKYVFWLMIYLLSLPIWNFVLPVYAFWHFDEFSWGETRQVEGEAKKGEGHGDGGGLFDHTQIVMRKWHEWERERRAQYQALLAQHQQQEQQQQQGRK